MSLTETELWDITESYLAAEHLELDELEVLGKGRARMVKVTVDGEGLDLDRIADVSRGLSRLYDAEYDPEGSYQLEVTSPGLERALKRPRHFQKSVGRDVALKGRDPEGKVETHRGVLVEADDSGVTVRVDGSDIRYPYDAVISARTVFRWEPAPKPGR
ncbi:MAG TPA: ribosome maturation factor RimP [Acidimicrobiia bacterium]|jgi:ribosome maturation factor RimP|nr:ribosome maturation factor RimP [Acidimicrobiia bacterium]